MIKNFPKLKEDNKPQVQEAQNAPNWVYKNKNTPGHINFIQLKIENFLRQPRKGLNHNFLIKYYATQKKTQ